MTTETEDKKDPAPAGDSEEFLVGVWKGGQCTAVRDQSSFSPLRPWHPGYRWPYAGNTTVNRIRRKVWFDGYMNVHRARG